MKSLAVVAFALTTLCATARADPVRILFVGNSYTFGRLDPVMRYNAARVHDLTAGFHAIDPTGTNPWEPHPWGGVPGIFEQLSLMLGGLGFAGWCTKKRANSATPRTVFPGGRS